MGKQDNQRKDFQIGSDTVIGFGMRWCKPDEIDLSFVLEAIEEMTQVVSVEMSDEEREVYERVSKPILSNRDQKASVGGDLNLIQEVSYGSQTELPD